MTNDSYSKMYCTDVIAIINDVADLLQLEADIKRNEWKASIYNNLQSRRWCFWKLSYKHRRKFFKCSMDILDKHLLELWYTQHSFGPSWTCDDLYEEDLALLRQQAENCLANEMSISTSHSEALYFYEDRIKKMKKEIIGSN